MNRRTADRRRADRRVAAARWLDKHRAAFADPSSSIALEIADLMASKERTTTK